MPHAICLVAKEWFDEYHERIDATHIYLGDNRSHHIHDYGLICVNLPSGQKKHIHNVLYVPSIKKNLIFRFHNN